MAKKSVSDAAPKPVDGPGRKKVTLYLPEAQWRALKVHAAQNDKEMSEVVSAALSKLGIHG